MFTEGKLIINYNQDRYSIGTCEDPVCDFWQLQEETHDFTIYENAEANAKEFLRRWNSQPALLAACKIGLTEMMLWRGLDECDCPPEGHICGIPRLEQSIKITKQAIEAANP